VYGFNREGVLTYSGEFAEMTIPVEQAANLIWNQSQVPAEMGVGELRERIVRAAESGLPTNELRVELHQRFALPLASVVFILVGGAVSLMFGSRSRATGIIVGLVLIGIWQGALLWSQALGRRGAMNPALAAWVPDLLFLLVGLVLFLRVDHLASRDLWNRIQRKLPFLTTL